MIGGRFIKVNMAKKEPQKLVWKTVKRKVDDLIPLEINPRKITPERQQRLIQSLEKFNLAEIPIVNFDNTLIGGNQRFKVMQLVGRGKEIIDVRYPNRQLTEQEVKEYALTSNSHAGEWDFELLESEFSDFNLEDFDIKLPNLDDQGNEVEEGGGRTEGQTKAPEEAGPKRWFVYADCVNEKKAQELYVELTGRGFETKVVN